MNSGRTGRNKEYVKRTVFGCTRDACTAGSNGARNHFDLLWSWLDAGAPGARATRPQPNQGQAASTVQFVSRGSGYALILTPGKVVLNLERRQSASGASVDTLRMSL